MYSLGDLVSTRYFLSGKVNAYLVSYSIINSFNLAIRANWLSQAGKGNFSSVPTLQHWGFSKLNSTWTGGQ